MSFAAIPITAAICPNTLATFTTIVNRIDQVHPKSPPAEAPTMEHCSSI